MSKAEASAVEFESPTCTCRIVNRITSDRSFFIFKISANLVPGAAQQLHLNGMAAKNTLKSFKVINGKHSNNM